VKSFNGYVIGCTATPVRTGKQTALSEIYDTIVNEVQVGDLIKEGYLSTPYSYGIKIDLSKIGMKGGDYDGESLAKYYGENGFIEQVLSNYRRLADGEKTIIFAPNTDTGKQLKELFILSGYNAFYVDSYMNDVEEVTKAFESTENGILINYQLYTTGYDHKPIQCVILFRATNSITTFMQMVGRGSRITQTKKTFKILDFGNNFLNHGFWQSDREWSLEKKKGREKLGLAPVKICPKCAFLNSPTATICEICKTVLPKPKKKKVKFSEITLELIENNLSKGVVDKVKICKQKGYKMQWLMYKLTDEERIEFSKYMGYDRAFAERFQ
jgi:superfamily II DNA or RNA helicase